MTAPSILVLLTAPAGARATLDVASAAARALEAPTIEVLHVRLDPVRTIMPSEEVLTSARIQAVEGASAVEGAATFAAFSAWQAAGHGGHWTEVIGEPADEVGRRGRDADLVVLTLPRPHAPLAERAALEAAVFATGRPVLAVPADWHGGFGQHLAVGWRDAAATRHALAGMRPWLRAARMVTALTIGDTPVPVADGPLAGLPGQLALQTITHGAHGDGAALLAAAEANGADGLAMGAYRRGRILEWVLGGATEHVLHHATLPLLLMH